MHKHIGIFGGSFNPPHLGHVAICDFVLQRKMVDEIWVIPCFEHPWDKKLLPFKDRLTMCQFAFQKFRGKVFVSRVEEELGEVSYTDQTLAHLEKKYPDFSFSIVVGMDSWEERGKWHGWDSIKDRYAWIVIPRSPDSPIPNVSANQIRQMLAGRKNISHLVPKEVAVYIVTKGLLRH